MAKLWKAIFLMLCFHISAQYAQGTSWDQLRVTYAKFTNYPLTSKQAKQNGWEIDARCSGRPNFFYGNRFVRGDDDTTRLIFDCDGSLAGIQATIDKTQDYPTIYNQPPWISTDDGRVAVTAYFRDPREICVCKGKCKKRIQQKSPIGDRLWIQMTDFRLSRNVMVMPLNVEQIEGTPWVEGTCVGAMGIHYHYNISVDFDCDKALPVFLLFSQQTKSLIGFGFGGPIYVPSVQWEKPHPSIFARSMKAESIPACLKNYKTVSVQHVYFVDPLKIVCS